LPHGRRNAPSGTRDGRRSATLAPVVRLRSAHPQTKRSYLQRSYVIHDASGRRMFGRTRKGYAYLACEPDARHHASRDWYPTHPKSIWVREDALLAAVHDFFTTRILGPDRRRLLASQLNTHPPVTDDTASRRAQLAKHIDALRRRQTNLLDQLEQDQDDDLDPDTRRAFRKTIRDRFADLAGQIHRAEADRDALRPPGTTVADHRTETQTSRSNGVSLVLCGPGRIRTCDTRFRRAVLYPLSYEA
jgi:hypothetical protein